MRVALVHDDFTQEGGAESLFVTIAKLYPKSHIYTALVNWGKFPQGIEHERVKTSFIQKIPFASKIYKALLPLYPLAFESFDFDKYDLVISSTTRFAKSVITKPSTTHICYINSIPRFLWDKKAQKEYAPPLILSFLKPLLTWLKRWDVVASSRPDLFIANSQNVAFKVNKAYGRESQVIYPFADLDHYKPAGKGQKGKYLLVVTRLVKWKKIDIAIHAAQKLGTPLKIVGTGPDEKRLKNLSMASSRLTIDNKIEFLGKVTREELRDLYQNSLALVVTQEEDFGIASVEAQACAKPIVAFEKGGVAEIVVNGETGILFAEQTVKSCQDAISAALDIKWSEADCRRNAMRFSQVNFVENLKKILDSKLVAGDT